MSHHYWLSALCVAGVTLAASAGGTSLKYPDTKRGDQVDDYHGTKVADPYRWLEADVRESRKVAAWVAAENKVTFAYLNSIPQRDAIKKRITDLWNYEKISAPHRHGPRYVFSKNDGLQNQSVVYTQETLESPPVVLLDPNQWSKDGTVALGGLAFSEDGKYLAYGVAESGSDWNTWKVMHVESGKQLSDELHWLKYTGGVAWTRDNRGFFYTRYPEPKPGEKYQGLPLNCKLYYHRLGTPQSEDVLVYHRPDQPTWSIYGEVTDDGRYLIIDVGDGTTSGKSRIVYKDLNEPYGLPVDLIDNAEAVNDFIANDGPIFYFHTDRDAPQGPRRGHRHPPAGAKEWQERGARGPVDAQERELRRQPADLQLSQGCPHAGQDAQARWPLRARGRFPRHRHGNRLHGPAAGHRDLLHVRQLQHPRPNLSL